MADRAPAEACRELNREDVEAALTKLLRHGYGSLTVKIHGHRITALESTIRQTQQREPGPWSEPVTQGGREDL